MGSIILPYPSNTYPCLTMDPGWDGREKGCNGFAGVPGYDVNAGSQYDVMSLAEIEAFGREAIRVARGQRFHLWLWTIDLFLEEALDLIPTWGLQRKRGYIWVKTTNGLSRGHKGLEGFSARRIREAEEVMRAAGYPGKPYARTGHWGKLGHEYLLMATNDRSFRTLNAKFEYSVFFAPAPPPIDGRTHSRKPPEAYEIICRNSPGPRLACFEREHRPGFTCWGNDPKLVVNG